MTRSGVVFGCSHCDATFVTAEGLRAHAARHHRYRLVQPTLPEPRQPRQPASLVFSCSHCGEVFPSRWQLRSHLSCHGVFPAPEWQPAGERRPRVRPIPAEFSVGAGRPPYGAAAVGPAPTGRNRVRPVAVHAAMVAAAVLVVLIAVASATAMFSSTVMVSSALSTATWGPELAFSPGSALAVHVTSTGALEVRPIASLDSQGLPSLDFGVVDTPSDRRWIDVFRLTSESDAEIHLSFSPSGSIAPFLNQITLSGDPDDDSLAPDQTRSVELGVTMTEHTPSGAYNGALRVTVEGSDEAYSIPMTVSVTKPATEASPSAAPSRSPSPAPSPSATDTPPPPGAADLFRLSPGASVAPSADESTPTPVAAVQADGTLSLDFGQLPSGVPTTFEDAFRMTSRGADATVELVVSGPAAALIRRVGFWDESMGIVATGLVLRQDSVQRIAFEVAAPDGARPGKLDGRVTIAATSAGGREQTSVLPMTVTIPTTTPAASPSPSDSAAPSGSPTTAPGPSTSPGPPAPPSPTASPSPSAAATPETTPSQQGSSSPAPAASPGASLPSTGSTAAVAADEATVWTLESLLHDLIGPTAIPLPEILASWLTRSVALTSTMDTLRGF